MSNARLFVDSATATSPTSTTMLDSDRICVRTIAPAAVGRNARAPPIRSLRELDDRALRHSCDACRAEIDVRGRGRSGHGRCARIDDDAGRDAVRGSERRGHRRVADHVPEATRSEAPIEVSRLVLGLTSAVGEPIEPVLKIITRAERGVDLRVRRSRSPIPRDVAIAIRTRPRGHDVPVRPVARAAQPFLRSASPNDHLREQQQDEGGGHSSGKRAITKHLLRGSAMTGPKAPTQCECPISLKSLDF